MAECALTLEEHFKYWITLFHSEPSSRQAKIDQGSGSGAPFIKMCLEMQEKQYERRGIHLLLCSSLSIVPPPTPNLDAEL